MKKIFTLILISSFYLQSYSQVMQASIASSSPNNRVKIYLKSNISHSGIISTLQFNIGVEAAGLITPPTLTVVSSAGFPGVTWLISTPPYLEGGFWNYNIYTTDNLAPNIVANVEFEAMEIEFNSGFPVLGNVALVTLPDGGSTPGNALFLCNGGSPTIQSDGMGLLYYARSGVTLQNQNSYDQVTFAPQTGISYALLTGVTLPVKFISFTATKKDNSTVLNWQIENETSLTDRYEVERSSNGVDFTKISTIAPKNNGRSANGYTSTDADLSSIHSGVVYYRIKQTDKDGQFIYTEIKSVRLDSKAISASVYPNPVGRKANLSIDLVDNSPINITVNDANGKQVQSIKLNGIKGVNKKEIDMSSLSRGNYMLRIQTNTESTTLPVVKGN